MTDQSSLPSSWHPHRFLRALLFAFAALTGIEMGAGAFVTSVIFPLWTASPQAAIGWTTSTPYYVEEGVFFIIASPLLFLLSIVTLVAGWRAIPPLRLWLRIATIAYILVFIMTLAYFVPLQDMVKGEAGTKIPAAELSSMLRRFVTFNYIRQAIGLLTFGAALHALGLSYRMADRREG
jgi:hypothetical protein